jgi:hypothetical protein
LLPQTAGASPPRSPCSSRCHCPRSVPLGISPASPTSSLMHTRGPTRTEGSPPPTPHPQRCGAAPEDNRSARLTPASSNCPGDKACTHPALLRPGTTPRCTVHSCRSPQEQTYPCRISRAGLRRSDTHCRWGSLRSRLRSLESSYWTMCLRRTARLCSHPRDRSCQRCSSRTASPPFLPGRSQAHSLRTPLVGGLGCMSLAGTSSPPSSPQSNSCPPNKRHLVRCV